MNGSILVWLNNSFVHFGIVNLLQHKTDYDFYGVAYVNDNARKFLIDQNLVIFKKLWFYPDHLSNKNISIDFEYLKNFEIKYNLELWKIAFADRYFHWEFNKYYKFSKAEILQILQQASQFYEDILNTVKPDYIMMEMPVHHNDLLLYTMCKNLGIKILMLRPSRLGYRMMITQDVDEFDEIDISHQLTSTNDLSYNDDLEKYYEKFNSFKQIKSIQTIFKIPLKDKIRAQLEFLFYSNPDYTNHYINYGKSKLSVIVKGSPRRFYFRKKKAEKFLNKFCLKNIHGEKNFIFFPLHQEPERVLLIGSPYYANQLEVIRNISKSLPINYRLFVKEHIAMSKSGYRDISFYKELLKFPNVVLVHPEIEPKVLMKNCSLVITINGTAAFESSIYRKPSIILTPTKAYSEIPSIYHLENIHHLTDTIKTALKHNVEPYYAFKFIQMLEKNSFIFDRTGWSKKFNKSFYYYGYMKDPQYSENKIKNFLEDNKTDLQRVVEAHLVKIMKFKNYQ